MKYTEPGNYLDLALVILSCILPKKATQATFLALRGVVGFLLQMLEIASTLNDINPIFKSFKNKNSTHLTFINITFDKSNAEFYELQVINYLTFSIYLIIALFNAISLFFFIMSLSSKRKISGYLEIKKAKIIIGIVFTILKVFTMLIAIYLISVGFLMLDDHSDNSYFDKEDPIELKAEQIYKYSFIVYGSIDFIIFIVEIITNVIIFLAKFIRSRPRHQKRQWF